MTNKWKIEIILKCGKEVVGYYNGKEECTTDVVKTILSCDVFGMGNENYEKNILVMRNEIAAITVSKA